MLSCSSIPPMHTSNEIVWLKQGWSLEDRQKFHHASQGTMTIPIPYEWLAALEQPGFVLFGQKGLIIENGYLSRLGFIPGDITHFNQAGLPVGFSVDYNVVNPAISETPFNAVGLTCAACHTGQMRVRKTTHQGDKFISVRYDGGPAVTDLSQLITVLAWSLIETYLDESRFERFAQRVLGITNTEENRHKLKKQLRHTLSNQVSDILQPAEIKTTGFKHTHVKDLEEKSFIDFIKIARNLLADRKKSTAEGYTRLDALNRIGNTVFATDTGHYENAVNITAPVNYPFIWNTSWFLWVQYDASIMGPMIRNTGEAMGVAAYVVMDNEAKDNFNSSVKLDNLYWMETLLAGKTPPTENRKFGGLQPPAWQEEIFGKIDSERHRRGGRLYAELCQGCHLPPIDSEEFWSDKYWTKADKYGRRYLDLPIVDLNYINTDPGEARILIDRKVNTLGSGIDTKLYVESIDWFHTSPVYFGADNTQCNPLQVKQGARQAFSVSLGAAVQQVNDYWYKYHGISKNKQAEMNGFRMNCLRAPLAYKARPLNGVWATAPFLHNGSVPNIYALLSPLSERPKQFYLGNLNYDLKKMGYDVSEEKGYFLLDTSIKGNFNTGHEFSDIKQAGVIGRGLSVEERYDLIEYLKDIRVVK